MKPKLFPLLLVLSFFILFGFSGRVSAGSYGPSVTVVTGTDSANNHWAYPTATCPAGYMRVGCSGWYGSAAANSRNGYFGTWPVGNSGCRGRSADYTSSNNDPTAYAYCVNNDDLHADMEIRVESSSATASNDEAVATVSCPSGYERLDCAGSYNYARALSRNGYFGTWPSGQNSCSARAWVYQSRGDVRAYAICGRMEDGSDIDVEVEMEQQDGGDGWESVRSSCSVGQSRVGCSGNYDYYRSNSRNGYFGSPRSGGGCRTSTWKFDGYIGSGPSGRVSRAYSSCMLIDGPSSYEVYARKSANSDDGATGEVRFNGGSWQDLEAGPSETYLEGEQVTIEARGTGDYQFDGWSSSDCNDPDDSVCVFEVDSQSTNWVILTEEEDETVPDPEDYTVNVFISSQSDPGATGEARFNYGSWRSLDTSETFTDGTEVTVSARGTGDYRFDMWNSDPCGHSADPDCTFNVISDTTLYAILVEDVPEPDPSGALSCSSSTENSVTLNYNFSDSSSEDVSLFRGSTRLDTFSGSSGSGNHTDSNLDSYSSYTYYLRDGTTASSNLLDSAACSTDREEPDRPGPFTSPADEVWGGEEVSVNWGETPFWGNPDTNRNYKLEVSYNGGSYLPLSDTGIISEYNHDIPANVAIETIRYRVRSESGGGYSAWREHSSNITVNHPVPEAHDLWSSDYSSEDYCAENRPPAKTVRWEYFSETGHEYVDSEIEISEGDNDFSDTFDTVNPGPVDSYTIGEDLSFNRTYYWRVRVRNENGYWSDWEYSDDHNANIETGERRAAPDFSWQPSEPYIQERVEFSDQSTPGSKWITDYEWEFEGGQPEKATGETVEMEFRGDQGDRRVSLKVIDGDGVVCEIEKDISVRPRLPDWREVY